MFQSSVGWSSNSAVYQMINANNPEQISIPANKIVVGKHSLGDGSDFVDGNTLKNIFNQALATNSPVWNTGFMCWQFYTENNQYPKFQVINEVVNANWDLTVTSVPTPPPIPTPAPIPTTANPTTNGGGSGCVNGNICIKVKAFAAIPSQSTPIWWWSIYDENIINSLTSGCIITDCTAIEIKQSNTNEWIRAGNENGDCGINMVNNPFRSTIISIDFRITTTNNYVIISNGVVQDATANKEWDFGSNFVSCTTVPNPTKSPLKSPSKIPTQRPSNRPSVTPTKNPSHITVTQNTPKKSFVFGIKQYVIIGILSYLIIICFSCAIIRIIKYYCNNKHKTILSSNTNKAQMESVINIKMHDLHSIPSVTNTHKSSDGSTSFMTHTDSADLPTMEQPPESVIVTPKQNIDI